VEHRQAHPRSQAADGAEARPGGEIRGTAREGNEKAGDQDGDKDITRQRRRPEVNRCRALVDALPATIAPVLIVVAVLTALGSERKGIQFGGAVHLPFDASAHNFPDFLAQAQSGLSVEQLPSDFKVSGVGGRFLDEVENDLAHILRLVGILGAVPPFRRRSQRCRGQHRVGLIGLIAVVGQDLRRGPVDHERRVRVVPRVVDVLVEGVTGVVTEDDITRPVALGAPEVRHEPRRCPTRWHYRGMPVLLGKAVRDRAHRRALISQCRQECGPIILVEACCHRRDGAPIRAHPTTP
jgi:hypothetical protein